MDSKLTSLKKENETMKAKIRDNTGANERVMEKLQEYISIVDNLNTSLDQNVSEAVKHQFSKLQGIQNLFNELFTESQKNNEEVRDHERCFTNAHTERVDLVTSETDYCERQETHTKQQFALSSELQEVTKIEKLGDSLQQELNIFISTVDAEATLTHLLEDRATLQEQLDNLKDGSNLEDSIEVKQIEEDIELRSIQIQELQQKILDSDQENKSSSRWDHIQTMAEAKSALKFLFDWNADINIKYNEQQRIIQEVRFENEELRKRLNDIKI